MYWLFLFVLIINCSMIQSITIPDKVFDDTALTCMKKLELSKRDVDKFLDENLHIIRGPKLDALLICENTVDGYFNVNGDVIVEYLKSDIYDLYLPLLQKDDVKVEEDEISEKCRYPSGEGIVERYVNIHNCLIDALKQVT
ncbi:hypothetical protein FQA39_LY08215 [Lamprigera yunnana]|nr:hypothetical protein FQA39_LY08215 [Lamprigera yunnana]